MILQYVELSFLNLPVSFSLNINDSDFKFIIRYNSRMDFFTVEIYDSSEVLLVSSKMCYFSNLLSCVISGLEGVILIPLDLAEFDSDSDFLHSEINRSNFDSMSLCIVYE